MILYVSGPYSAESKEERQANVEKAEEIGKQLLLLGHVPIISHKIASHWDEDERLAHFSHSDWIERLCIPMVDACQGVVMVPGWEFSKGAVLELHYASERRKPVYFDVEEIL